MKKHLFTTGFTCLFLTLFAQLQDSIKRPAKSPIASYFTEDHSFTAVRTTTFIDTSMDGVQKYFPNNFPYSLSLTSKKYFFEPTADIGFSDGLNKLDIFGYNKRDIKYYRTRAPYTDVFVLFGIKKEQFAKLLHTQNITRQWNVAFNMLRINMLGTSGNTGGFYNRQKFTDNNLSFSSNYTSKNNRYSFLMNAIISSIKGDENGGIKNDLYFENDPFGDKKLIPVNLQNARSKRRYRSAYMKHFFSFGKKENVMKGDSVIAYRLVPKSSFSYSFNAQDNIFMYTEGSLDSGYYKNIYFDSTQTYDSTRVFVFQHAVAWNYVIGKNIATELAFNQQTSHVFQYATDSLLAMDTLIQDYIAFCRVGNAIDGKTHGFYWNSTGAYIVSGSNQGDYLIQGDLSYLNKNTTRISLGVLTDLHSVPFVFQSYNSNHFKWKNSFSKIGEIQTRLSWLHTKNNLFAEIKWNQIANYVNFDGTFSPRQFSDAIHIYTASIEKKFRFKKIRFNNTIFWQSVGSSSQQASKESIRLPQFVTNHSLYLEDKWFKNRIDIQLGFDFSFFTSYYADAYMPALGHYYMQNEKKIGNYPFIDFFFNLKIKHARLFIKSEHVNSGLLGANYYLAPHLPAPDRSFKIGLKWMFYD